jgi:hypothetical protein
VLDLAQEHPFFSAGTADEGLCRNRLSSLSFAIQR